MKQLNTELQEKNALLKELLEKEKQYPNKISYADATRNTQKPKMFLKPSPKVVVKRKDKQNKTGASIEKYLKHYLTKEKSIQTKNIYFKNEDEAIIRCMNIDSALETEKILSRKIGQYFKVEKETIQKPRLKVVGIDKTIKTSLKEFETDINERNFKNSSTKCTALHTFRNSYKDTQSVVIEVSSEIYKTTKENKSKIFVRFQSCRVCDDINVKPCYNCCKFGHNASKCHNNSVCIKCSGQHKSIDCKNNQFQNCANYLYSNSQYKTNYNVNHVATDYEKCEVLKKRIKQAIDIELIICCNLPYQDTSVM